MAKQYTRFKIAYRVLFDAKDLEDRCLIDTTTQNITLMIRSVYKEVILNWETTSDLLHCKKEVSEEDAATQAVIPVPQQEMP